ncbi:flagellar basal-body MS-ring/collar protein FliF [Primorskyibacter sp. S87]|uniref:flagellar basal-body MS-ring/collar protein FliF n=1 Tax=Primorskyibacter sp. S87 TaxID=3415126 RepID=UPI003C7B8E0D
MEHIEKVWTGLDRRKQIIVVAAGLVLVISLFTLSRLAVRPSLTLLYAGLDSQPAGEIVSALEQRGVDYEVRGGSIFVPDGQRDELRMTLASSGLPSNGGKGYELLDTLSGFGTTSQMFDAAYWRAIEGELARTIVASPQIVKARVHIASAGSNPFRRKSQLSASVSVVPSGAPISQNEAEAVRYLVASAVAGLGVENVAVIDANGSVVGGSSNSESASNSAENRANVLRERVLRLVEARVGAGNAVVEVSVDTVTETESIRERRFDPNSRVAISTETEERADSSQNQTGEVTVASNLPDGDAAGRDSQSKTSSTRESINYEVSETELEIVRIPGAVRRLSVAVLVNGLQVTDDTGQASFEPRPEPEMAALRELVQSAVGFDAERGDVVTLKSMELPEAVPLGATSSTPVWGRLHLNVMTLIQVGVLALVSIVLGIFVIRPILTRPQALPPPLPDVVSGPGQLSSGPFLSGEIDEGSGESLGAQALPAPASDRSLQETPDAKSAIAVERLRSMIGDKQEETVEILRGWLEENGEKAS